MINIYIFIYIKEYWLKKTHEVSFGIMKQKKNVYSKKWRSKKAQFSFSTVRRQTIRIKYQKIEILSYYLEIQNYIREEIVMKVLKLGPV